MPSNHLCHPLLLLSSVFPSIRIFCNELALPIKWPKYWSSSFSSVLPMTNSGLIPLSLVWSCSQRDCQESSPASQFKSISSLVLHLLYGPPLTCTHYYWKNHSFDYINLCQQSNVSVFNMLSGFVIAFLPRSKRLLLSWLLSTIFSDFGAKKNKVCHCFHWFPIYLPWSDATKCHDLCFLNDEL